jgi:hypothetical protein
MVGYSQVLHHRGKARSIAQVAVEFSPRVLLGMGFSSHERLKVGGEISEFLDEAQGG